jgi:2-(1,2-epoxy-1,2-dihydrophenyl)acetyl-CoA isomerase
MPDEAGPTAILSRPAAGVATITLNRSHALNAFTDEMLELLASLAAEVNADESIAAVILTGSGRAFCAGRDRSQLAGAPGRPGIAAVPEVGSAESSFVRDLLPVVVAAARGAIVGGGFGMFLQADIRVASEDAYVLDGHVRAGMIPSSETWYLARGLPMKRALEVAVLGQRITAEQALADGLVDQLTTAEDLAGVALGIAGQYAAVSAALVRQTKRVLHGYMRAIQWGRAAADAPADRAGSR